MATDERDDKKTDDKFSHVEKKRREGTGDPRNQGNDAGETLVDEAAHEDIPEQPKSKQVEDMEGFDSQKDKTPETTPGKGNQKKKKNK